MTDPRIESLSDLTFRDRAAPVTSRRGGPDRFWTGVAIFLLAVMAYPFYSHSVHSYLVARDLQAAAEALDEELVRVSASAKRESEERARRSAAMAVRERQRSVSVTGTTVIGGRRIAIVDLGAASLVEAKARICSQSELHFREDLGGQRLHVQRHRGKQPAVDAGVVVCD